MSNIEQVRQIIYQKSKNLMFEPPNIFKQKLQTQLLKEKIPCAISVKNIQTTSQEFKIYIFRDIVEIIELKITIDY